MAQIDFSNAVLTPYTYNPTTVEWTGLYDSSSSSGRKIVNSSGTVITSSVSFSQTVNQKKKAVYVITGTFNTSGTEFYIYNKGGIHWRVSNITFASGDTFQLQISATLINS